MEACELTRSVYYDRIRRLKELYLIAVDDLEDTNRKRFRIVRSNIAENACHHRQARTKAKGSRTKSRPAYGQPVQQMDHNVQHADDSVHYLDESVQNTDQSVQNMDGTILLTPTVPNCPTTVTKLAGMATAADVIRGMIECGVEHPTPAVETAILRGCVPCELMEIVRHFKTLSVRHGFKAGALQRRISNHAPGMPLDAGWPQAKPKAVPKEDLESTFGPLLNALEKSEADLADLIQRHGSDAMKAVQQMTSAVSMARSDQWRPHLLKILKGLEEHRGPDQM